MKPELRFVTDAEIDRLGRQSIEPNWCDVGFYKHSDVFRLVQEVVALRYRLESTELSLAAISAPPQRTES